MSWSLVAGYQPWKTATENGVDYASYDGVFAEGRCQQIFGFEWEDASAPSADVTAALTYKSGSSNLCSKTGSDINTKLVSYCIT